MIVHGYRGNTESLGLQHLTKLFVDNNFVIIYAPSHNRALRCIAPLTTAVCILCGVTSLCTVLRGQRVPDTASHTTEREQDVFLQS